MTRATTFLGWFLEPDGEERVGPLTAAEVVALSDAGRVRTGARILRAWQDENGVYFYLSSADVARREASTRRGERGA